MSFDKLVIVGAIAIAAVVGAGSTLHQYFDQSKTIEALQRKIEHQSLICSYNQNALALRKILDKAEESVRSLQTTLPNIERRIRNIGNIK